MVTNRKTDSVNLALQLVREQARREALTDAANYVRAAARAGGFPPDAEPEYVLQGIALSLDDLAFRRAVDLEPDTPNW